MHFAGSIVVPDSVSHPLDYYHNNVVASAHLLRACLDSGIGKFVFSSTAAVYDGDGDNGGALSEDADLAPARRILELMLERHDPYPALVFNRHWDLMMANMGAATLTQLLNLPPIDGPANLLRLMLHPDMLKPHLEDWQGGARDMVLRARREAEPGDEIAMVLLDEVLAYPGAPEDWRDLAMESAKAPFLTVTFNAGGRRLS